MTVPIDAELAGAGGSTSSPPRPTALDELRRWSAVLAAGRRWPVVAEPHAALYEEVIADAERAARRRLRAG